MLPTLLLLAGLVLLAAGGLLLRRLGPTARVGRILAATPVVPIARARAMAAQGRPQYVAVNGRIDAQEPFEDELHRPLVFRRIRLEAQSPAGWTVLEDHREVAAFDIVDGLERIAVDTSAIDTGLVAIVRESVGTAADVPDRVAPGTPPSTAVRLRIEQVSSVEHAVVLGVPAGDLELGPILGPGLGRPLILTTLEPDEAMRVLAVDRRTTTRVAALALAAGAVSAVVGLGWTLIDAVI